MQLPGNNQRILSVDILRGIAMVLMALDHTRDYFSDYHLDPTDLSRVSAFLFFTRWITHFCAPVFIFLSGTSAMLSLNKGKSKKELSWYLLTRGIWLIILELTIVRLGWQFNFDYSFIFVQVIWAIGWSMIFLSVLVFLPVALVAIIGFTIVFGHNLLDHIPAERFGGNAIWWNLAHESGDVAFLGNNLVVMYPLIPWIGVMALGYCFGKILFLPIVKMYRTLHLIGGGAILLFLVLRYTNLYGDPHPWEHHQQWWRTALSFVNCQKYPPSLLYLLMTLGPAIFVMPWLENIYTRTIAAFSVFGRVPLFYYILHIYLIHGMALIVGLVLGYPLSLFTTNGGIFAPNTGWGFTIDVVYGFWLFTVMLLYLPCKWFMNVKRRYSNWWLSYL